MLCFRGVCEDSGKQPAFYERKIYMLKKVITVRPSGGKDKSIATPNLVEGPTICSAYAYLDHNFAKLR